MLGKRKRTEAHEIEQHQGTHGNHPRAEHVQFGVVRGGGERLLFVQEVEQPVAIVVGPEPEQRLAHLGNAQRRVPRQLEPELHRTALEMALPVFRPAQLDRSGAVDLLQLGHPRVLDGRDLRVGRGD